MKANPHVSYAPAPDDLKLPQINDSKTVTGGSLTAINGKHLYYKKQGNGSMPVVFVHGLGSSSEFFTPLIKALDLNTSHQLHLLDLEGHGLSPTSLLSPITIESLADDLNGMFEKAGLTSASEATIVAHSMGCLVTLLFAIKYPEKVARLVLLGPAPNPLSSSAVVSFNERASLVRRKGMLAVTDTVATAGTSRRTKSTLGFTTVRLSLLGTEPESYAKGCTALAGCKQLPLECVHAKTLIITGDEDKISPPALCVSYAERIPHSLPPIVLKEVGHWHIFEDFPGVADAIGDFV
jgi:pimeloyl-ACP methyl ester carboxylesterase